MVELPLHHGVPPLEEHALADETEPGSILQGFVCTSLSFDVGEHLLELILADPSGVAHFICVNVESNVGLDKEDVVDLMLAPLAITGCLVVYSCEEAEVREWNLLALDAQLVIQLPDCGPLGSVDVAYKVTLARFSRVCERMAAAGIGPHIRKRDLLCSTLLQ